MHRHLGWLNPNLPATDEMGSKMNSPRHLTIVPDSNPFLGAPGNSKLLYWKLYVANNGLLIPLLISNLDPHHLDPVPHLDIEKLIKPLWLFSSISTNSRSPVLKLADSDVDIRLHVSKPAANCSI